jgi:hypothetical protein
MYVSGVQRSLTLVLSVTNETGRALSRCSCSIGGTTNGAGAGDDEAEADDDVSVVGCCESSCATGSSTSLGRTWSITSDPCNIGHTIDTSNEVKRSNTSSSCW